MVCVVAGIEMILNLCSSMNPWCLKRGAADKNSTIVFRSMAIWFPVKACVKIRFDVIKQVRK